MAIAMSYFHWPGLCRGGGYAVWKPGQEEPTAWTGHPQPRLGRLCAGFGCLLVGGPVLTATLTLSHGSAADLDSRRIAENLS